MDRVSDDWLSSFMEGSAKDPYFRVEAELTPEMIMLAQEVKERRGQRCETCERFNADIGQRGSCAKGGWWNTDGYCSSWKA